jgi:hypothetical protein
MPRIAVLVLVSALALFSFIGLWEEEGCIIDPGGRCAPAPSQDEGCGIDPSGGACPDRQ